MRVPDEVLRCVTFVGPISTDVGGRTSMTLNATAFFVNRKSDDGKGWFSYLVTARHVARKFEGHESYVRINRRDGEARFVSVGDRWWYHPTDDSVDVAVVPWLPSIDEYDFQVFPESSFLTDKIIETENIGVGDEVFIAGLFTELSGKQKNVPVTRVGNVAMMPGEPIVSKDWPPMLGYLIEARSIGGLSGSPAFVRSTVSWQLPDKSFVTGAGPYWLLGLVHGHWKVQPDDNIDAFMDENAAFGKINMGIAIVTPAKDILAVINHPELIDMRNQITQKVKRKSQIALDSAEPVVQKTKGDAIIPIPTKNQFLKDLEKATRKRDKK
jgi:hypothetical protein